MLLSSLGAENLEFGFLPHSLPASSHEATFSAPSKGYNLWTFAYAVPSARDTVPLSFSPNGHFFSLQVSDWMPMGHLLPSRCGPVSWYIQSVYSHPLYSGFAFVFLWFIYPGLVNCTWEADDPPFEELSNGQVVA